jgi:2-deoxy-D-gluconate 3-dehydrogenase
MLADFDLSGQRALVTGAGRGIGRGIALALAEAGADVAVTSLGEPNAARVAQEVTALGRRGFGYAADGTRVEPMLAVAERVKADLGDLDILVNCIGDAIRGAVSEGSSPGAHTLTEPDWHTVIDLNLTQAFVGCHVFGPGLLAQRRGSVVNVSSFAAFRPSVLMSAYAAAKAGLTRFTESIALEWAPAGIRVNAIAPGTFPDRAALTEEQWQQRVVQISPTIPLGRPGDVREIGLATIFLCSAAASYITGQTLTVDGGRTLV